MSIKLNLYKTALRKKAEKGFRGNPMPRSMPPHYGIGSRDEAITYANAHRDNWKKSEDALEWLKREWTAVSAD